MSVVPQGPLRVLLAFLAVSLFGVSLQQGSTPLTLSAGIGATALLGLAAWGSRWRLRHAHYLVAGAMATPWIAWSPTQATAIAKLVFAALGLVLWAGFGLRLPKNTGPSPQNWRNALSLFGLSALWLAMGCMGGTLSSLLWTAAPNAAPISSPLAPNLLLGTALVAFRHGQFYLRPAP